MVLVNFHNGNNYEPCLFTNLYILKFIAKKLLASELNKKKRMKNLNKPTD